MLIIAIVMSFLAVTLAALLMWALGPRQRAYHTLQAKLQELETQQAQAEATKQEYAAKLQDAEENNRQFELIKQALSDVLYKLHIATGKVEWSDNLRLLYGYPNDEPTDTIEWWTAHIHPDDALKINEMMDILSVPTATDWTVDYRFQKADGTYVWVRDKAFILRNQSGEAVELIGVMSNKAAQESPSQV